MTTSVKVVNLANQDVQQHVFGDILKRQVVGELRVTSDQGEGKKKRTSSSFFVSCFASSSSKSSCPESD